MRKEIPKNLMYAICLLIIGIGYHLTYQLATLIPTNVNWLMSVYHDWGQYYLGWSYFREAAWAFPYGYIENFNYPAGTNVGYMDSIPLLAFLFKPFSAYLPANFQYFGWLLLINQLLLAYYTIKILSYYKLNRLLIIFAVTLVVFSPLMLYRGMNPGSTAHWLLLASVFNYLRSADKQNVHRINRRQAVLILIGALINPYFFLMLIAFNLILPFKHYFFDRLLPFKSVFLYLIISIVPSVLIWYAIGMLSFDNETSLEVNNSFGLYGANLNTFINPFYMGVLLPTFENLRPHQYEGFAYLGAGMLLFMGISLLLVSYSLLRGKALNAFFKWDGSKTFLLLLILFFSLFAITNQLTWKDRLLFEYPVPELVNQVGSIFRATGRLIWYLHYALIFFTFILFSRLPLNKILKTLLLLLICGLQFYDIQPLFGRHQYKVGDYSPAQLDDEKWASVLDIHDKLITYPPFNNSLLYASDYQDLCFLALKNDIPITTGYVARETTAINEAYFNALKDSLKKGSVEKSALYLTTQAELESFVPLVKNKQLKAAYLNGYFLFSASSHFNRDQLFSQEELNAVDSIMESVLPAYRILKGVPPTANGIRMNLEHFEFQNHTIKASGWAFIDGKKENKHDHIKLCLNTDSTAYVFDTKLVRRSDVTDYFKADNLDRAGFKTNIYTNALPAAEYKVSILIEDSTGILANQTVAGKRVVLE